MVTSLPSHCTVCAPMILSYSVESFSSWVKRGRFASRKSAASVRMLRSGTSKLYGSSRLSSNFFFSFCPAAWDFGKVSSRNLLRRFSASLSVVSTDVATLSREWVSLIRSLSCVQSASHSGASCGVNGRDSSSLKYGSTCAHDQVMNSCAVLGRGESMFVDSFLNRKFLMRGILLWHDEYVNLRQLKPHQQPCGGYKPAHADRFCNIFGHASSRPGCHCNSRQACV